jgi:hypothetical protein
MAHASAVWSTMPRTANALIRYLQGGSELSWWCLWTVRVSRGTCATPGPRVTFTSQRSPEHCQQSSHSITRRQLSAWSESAAPPAATNNPEDAFWIGTTHRRDRWRPLEFTNSAEGGRLSAFRLSGDEDRKRDTRARRAETGGILCTCFVPRSAFSRVFMRFKSRDLLRFRPDRARTASCHVVGPHARARCH